MASPKTCKKCGVTKTVLDFNMASVGGYGKSTCKACDATRCKRYSERQKEKRRAFKAKPAAWENLPVVPKPPAQDILHRFSKADAIQALERLKSS